MYCSYAPILIINIFQILSKRALSHLFVESEIFVLIQISISDPFRAFFIDIMNVSEELSFLNHKDVKKKL